MIIAIQATVRSQDWLRFFLLCSCVFLTASSSAHNKVVVIPLGGETLNIRKYVVVDSQTIRCGNTNYEYRAHIGSDTVIGVFDAVLDDSDPSSPFLRIKQPNEPSLTTEMRVILRTVDFGGQESLKLNVKNFAGYTLSCTVASTHQEPEGSTRPSLDTIITSSTGNQWRRQALHAVYNKRVNLTLYRHLTYGPTIFTLVE